MTHSYPLGIVCTGQGKEDKRDEDVKQSDVIYVAHSGPRRALEPSDMASYCSFNFLKFFLI